MKARRTAAVLTSLLSASPTVRLFAQGDVDRLALRFASMTAVTGLEQAMVDSLRALFPGSTRDHAGNVTLDRKSTRLNSSHGYISYAVFCLKKKKKLRQVADDKMLG